jgi:hypothetical protein
MALTPTAGFKVLLRRWIVERTFGWLMRQRQLARDYETTKTNAEAWINQYRLIRIKTFNETFNDFFNNRVCDGCAAG